MRVKKIILILGTPFLCVFLFAYGGAFFLSFGDLMFRPYVQKAANVCLILFAAAALICLFISWVKHIKKRKVSHAKRIICGIVSSLLLSGIVLISCVGIFLILFWNSPESVIIDNGNQYVQIGHASWGEIDRNPLLYPYVNFLVMDRRFIPPC